MRGSLDHPPIVVHTDRRKAAAHLLVALLFVALASPLALPDWDENGIAWLVVAVFGALAAGSLWELLWPGRLVIDEDGILQSDLWRRRRWSWSEARDFRPVSNRFWTFVGFTPGPWAGRRRWGIDGLNQDWELAPPVLAALLNEARRRWRG
jgi:hypothetical protein